jgi:hypothetical protein
MCAMLMMAGTSHIQQVLPPGGASSEERWEAEVAAKARLAHLARDEDCSHAFADVTCAEPFGTALHVLITAIGLGAIRPNTVLIGCGGLGLGLGGRPFTLVAAPRRGSNHLGENDFQTARTFFGIGTRRPPPAPPPRPMISCAPLRRQRPSE